MRMFLFAAAAGLVVAAFAPAAQFPNLSNHARHLSAAAATAKHKAHEERALIDIQTAEAEAKAGDVKKAEHAAAAALEQLHGAIGLHQHHQHLHHHHTHLTAAVADLKAAEKQFHSGHVGTAEKDLAKSAHQIREALKHHQ